MPTYVAGVELKNEKVYICPAFDDANAYTSSIPITHILDKQNTVATQQTLDMLKQDIIEYWNKAKANLYKSSFKSRL